MILEEMSEKFIKQKRYLGYKYSSDEIILKEFIKLLKEKNIEIITKEVIEDYVKHNLNYKPTTVNRNISTIKEFCLYLKTQGIEVYQIPDKKYRRKKQKRIPYIFTKKEMSIIKENLNCINNYHYDYTSQKTYPLIIKILYQTGMRIGEVINLKIKDYSKEEKSFILTDTKNNKERLIYLTDNPNEEILKYHKKFHYQKRIDDYFFKQSNGNKISVNRIEQYFYKILSLSNIKRTNEGPTLHCLRHTFIVHKIEEWINEGKDLDTMLKILQVYVGHESITSLEYYFQITKVMIDNIQKISDKKLSYIIPSIGDDENE